MTDNVHVVKNDIDGADTNDIIITPSSRFVALVKRNTNNVVVSGYLENIFTSFKTIKIERTVVKNGLSFSTGFFDDYVYVLESFQRSDDDDDDDDDDGGGDFRKYGVIGFVVKKFNVWIPGNTELMLAGGWGNGVVLPFRYDDDTTSLFYVHEFQDGGGGGGGGVLTLVAFAKDNKLHIHNTLTEFEEIIDLPSQCDHLYYVADEGNVYVLKDITPTSDQLNVTFKLCTEEGSIDIPKTFTEPVGGSEYKVLNFFVVNQDYYIVVWNGSVEPFDSKNGKLQIISSSKKGDKMENCEKPLHMCFHYPNFIFASASTIDSFNVIENSFNPTINESGEIIGIVSKHLDHKLTFNATEYTKPKSADTTAAYVRFNVAEKKIENDTGISSGTQKYVSKPTEYTITISKKRRVPFVVTQKLVVDRLLGKDQAVLNQLLYFYLFNNAYVFDMQYLNVRNKSSSSAAATAAAAENIIPLFQELINTLLVASSDTLDSFCIFADADVNSFVSSLQSRRDELKRAGTAEMYVILHTDRQIMYHCGYSKNEVDQIDSNVKKVIIAVRAAAASTSASASTASTSTASTAASAAASALKK